MRRMKSLGGLALALGLLLVVGCSEIAPAPYDYAQVEVVATRRSGEPVPGVRLLLYAGGRHMAYGTTESDGRYVFRFVPQGNYGVRAGPGEGYALVETLTGGRPSNVRDGLSIEEGSSLTLHYTFLKIGPGSIGLQVNTPEGDPVAGAPVVLRLLPRDAAGARTVATDTTDASGTVVFPDVPFGNYGVTVQAPQGFVTPEGDDRHVQDGILIEDGIQASLAFTLQRCVGRIRARVTDTTGAPVAGAGLQLYTFGQSVDWQKTDAAGEYTFGSVPCARGYGVRVQAPEGFTVPPGRGGNYVDGLEVEPGSELDVSFTLERQ